MPMSGLNIAAYRTMEDAAMLTTVGTEPVSLEDLEPFPGNARRGNVDLILDSLRANGQYKPLTVRRHAETLTILAGNHTYLALLRHEEDDRAACADWELSNDRPCQLCIAVDKDDPTALAHLIECDDATARRINVVDNRAADVGDYDQQALDAILATFDGDLVGTGYALSEADQFASEAVTDAGVEPLPADRLPEPGDAEQSYAEPTWGVVVRCGDETQQTKLLERLLAEGLDVRALSVM